MDLRSSVVWKWVSILRNLVQFSKIYGSRALLAKSQAQRVVYRTVYEYMLFYRESQKLLTKAVRSIRFGSAGKRRRALCFVLEIDYTLSRLLWNNYENELVSVSSIGIWILFALIFLFHIVFVSLISSCCLSFLLKFVN